LISALFAALLGCASIIWGLNTLNNPNCGSATITRDGRSFDVLCYPKDSLSSGWIPGNFLAIFLIVLGFCIVFGGYLYFQDLKKKKAAKDSSQVLAMNLLGEIAGHTPATYGSSAQEGNLYWSTESFLFLPDDPFPGGEDKIGPIHFREVDVPTFHIPIISQEGFSLRFGNPHTYLSFSSSSGKLKNLMKEIRKYKENP
jgi:hypothetical protein